MKSFRHYLNRLDRLAVGNLHQIARADNFKSATLIDRLKQVSIQTISLAIGCSTIVSSVSVWVDSVQAAPPRRADWCGVIWSIDNATAPVLTWINPNTGATNGAVGPTANITMPNGSGPGTSTAALGLHAKSGTMFAFDRTGTTGQLYKYRFGFDTAWQKVTTTGLVGLSGTATFPGTSTTTNSANNLNKMTVDGDILYIADTNGVALYSFNLDATGALLNTAAIIEKYSYSGIPASTPPLNGGDITTDEYLDTYNVTYDLSNNAYFFKQNPTTKTWIFQGNTAGNGQPFAGAAFYKGDLFVKTGTLLNKVDLTPLAGGGYTGWNNPVVAVGSATPAYSSADLTSCGTPNLVVNKTQKIYTDAALTTLSADQSKVKTGDYIQYTITAKNTGDTWARTSIINDTLPAGVNYVANSSALNGTSMGLTTYPTSGFNINSPGAPANIIRFLPDPDTATLSFAVQVTATSGAIKNRALVTYVDSNGTPSDPPVCATGSTGINCSDTGPVVVKNADVLLVKRITAINGNRIKNPNDNTPLNTFVDDTSSLVQTNDNNAYWPSSTYLLGALDAGRVKPGDEIEYTIYYLNAGAASASQVRICDRLAPNQTLKLNAYSTNQDLQLQLGSSAPIGLTSAADSVDRAQLIPVGGTIPTGCNLKKINSNGTLVVDVTGSSGAPSLNNVPASTAAGAPNDSYGLIRFTTTVNP